MIADRHADARDRNERPPSRYDEYKEVTIRGYCPGCTPVPFRPVKTELVLPIKVYCSLHLRATAEGVST